MSIEATIRGAKDELEAFRKFLVDDRADAVFVNEDRTDHMNAVRPLGMTAFEYLVVAFSAHISASVAHDMIHAALSRFREHRKQTSKIEVTSVTADESDE